MSDDLELKLVLKATDKGLVGTLKTAKGEVHNFGDAVNDASDKQNEAEESTERWTQKMGDLANVGGIVSGVLGGLTLGALVANVESTIEATKQTAAYADALKISIESLQVWQYANKTVGIEADKTADIFKDISEKIGDAYSNGAGEAQEVLDKLGLSAKDLVSLSPDQQLLAIANQLENVGSQSEKIQIMEALASDASLLLPLLDNNAEKLRELSDEAYNANAILSETDSDKLLEAGAAFREMSASGTALSNTLAVQLGPTVAEIAKWLSDTLPSAVDVGSDALHGMQLLVLDTASSITGGLADFYEVLAELPGFLGRGYASAAKDLREIEFTASGALKRYASSLAEGEKVTEKFSVTSGKMYDTLNKGVPVYNNISEARKQAADALKEHNQWMEETLDQYEKEEQANEDLYASKEQLLTSLERDIELTQMSARERAIATVIDKAHAQGIHNLDDKLTELAGRLYDVTEAAKDNANEAAPYAKTWERAIKSIDQSFADTWKGAFDSFDDFSDSLLDAFKTLLAEMAHEAITKRLVLSLSGSFTGAPAGAGQLASAGGFDASSILSSIGLPTSSAGLLGSVGGGGLLGAGSSIISSLGLGSVGASAGGALASTEVAALIAGQAGAGVGAGTGLLAGAGSGGLAGLGAGLASAAAVALPVAAIALIASSIFGDEDLPPGLRLSNIKGEGEAGFQPGDIVDGLSADGRGYTRTGAFGTLNFRSDDAEDQAEELAQQFGLSIESIIASDNVLGRALGDTVAEQITSAIYTGVGDVDRDLDGGLGNFLQGRVSATGNSAGGVTGVLANNFLEDIDGVESYAAFATLTSIADNVGTFIDDISALDDDRAITDFSQLGVNLLSVNAVVERLGKSAFELSLNGAELAESLSNASGGIDALLENSTLFYEAFYTENEKFGDLQDGLREQFNDLDVIMPHTREGFRNLVSGLDLTTDAGQNAYASLTSLTGSMQSYYNYVEGVQGRLDNLFTNTRESIYLGGLSNEGQYNYFKDKADTGAEELAGLTDPEDILALGQNIARWANSAWNALDETGKDANRPEFLNFFDDLKDVAGVNIDAALGIDNSSVELKSAVTELKVPVVDLGTATGDLSEVVKQLVGVVNNLADRSSEPLEINVNIRDNGSVVGAYG